MVNFFWTVEVIFNPEYGYCRIMSTKVNALITIIYDVYDVYGTFDELKLLHRCCRKVCIYILYYGR